MGIVIHNLRRQDATKAIDWAIQGMHFYWYVDSHFLLRCYSRYFWYL